MTEPFVITIPGTPDRSLNPNGRKHWGTKSKAFKAYRETAELATIATVGGVAHLSDDVRIEPMTLDYIIRWEKGRKQMDDDNAKAMLKAAQDGIAAALGVDDKHMTVGTLRQERCPDGVGSVTVTIRPSEDA